MPRPLPARLCADARLLGGRPGPIARHVNAPAQETLLPAFEHQVFLINHHVLTEES